jgi:hypothetical protein
LCFLLWCFLSGREEALAPPSIASRCEKVCILSATAFAESEDEANEALFALATCPLEDCVSKDLHASTPFEALFHNADRFWPEGKRYAVDTLWHSSPPSECWPSSKTISPPRLLPNL